MSQQNTPLRPGTAAIENMKLLKCDSSVFKVPRPMPKKVAKNSKVLDEEEYVKGIAKIIQRDFFPDLEKLKAQNDFLEATENKDYARLREITKKYSGQRPATEPYNSPATFDTPIDRPYSHSAPTECDMKHRMDTEERKNTQKDITDKHSLGL